MFEPDSIETQILTLWKKLSPEARERTLIALRLMLNEPEPERVYTPEELEAAFDEPSTFELLQMGETPPGWKPY